MAKNDTTALRQRGGESKKEEEETNQQAEDTSKTIKDGKPAMRKRKELPSVAYLLAHGDPETAGQPKTWMDIYGYPILLAAVFAVSLLIFHHAPHEKSVGKTNVLPVRHRPPNFQVPNAGQGAKPIQMDENEEFPKNPQ